MKRISLENDAEILLCVDCFTIHACIVGLAGQHICHNNDGCSMRKSSEERILTIYLYRAGKHGADSNN